MNFTHGSRDAIYLNHEELISPTKNYYILSNALVYTFSCLAGNELADILIQNNALTFWGYTEEALVNPSYYDKFVTCAMYGIFSFLAGATIKEAYNNTIECMNITIDEIYPKSVLAASFLEEDRDALIVKGDESLSISDSCLS